jgi:hypothetical protein
MNSPSGVERKNGEQSFVSYHRFVDLDNESSSPIFFRFFSLANSEMMWSFSSFFTFISFFHLGF